MRIGNKDHEDTVKQKLSELEKQGYKTIDLCGLSPTMIIAKNNSCKAVVIVRKTKKRERKGWKADRTHEELKNKYFMFDGVERIYHKKSVETRKELIDRAEKYYVNEGYNFIYTAMKSPDGLAIKDSKVIAVEILNGHKDGGNMKTEIKNKTDNYDMFDDVIVEVVYKAKTGRGRDVSR
jgi:hypothetical protein